MYATIHSKNRGETPCDWRRKRFPQRSRAVRTAFARHFRGLESLEPRLVLASIGGSVVQSNGSGGGVPGVTVFMDNNRNGILDGGERSVVTDSQGDYEFATTPPGDYNILALPKTGYTAETFDRLIGLASRDDSGRIGAYESDQTSDPYASLWEIDPENGFAINRYQITGSGGAYPYDVNFAGLTAIPNRPGWYLSQTQDQGTAAWNAFFECEAHLVSIHWEPGMPYAYADVVTDPGHDLTLGGGLDFDPSLDGDPNVVYGGFGDDYIWPVNITYESEWFWKTDLSEIRGLFNGTTDIADVFYPAYHWDMGDLAFDGYGNLYFLSGRLYELDKDTGSTLSSFDNPVEDGALEWNPDAANFWWANTSLGTINPTTETVTTIRSGFDFKVPPGEGIFFEGLELVGGFKDRPVELGNADVTGIHFNHVFRQVGISGTVFREANNNGYRDRNEQQGMYHQRVYLDGNANNRWDEGEDYRWSDQFGHYEFALLTPGIHRVAVQRLEGYDTVYPVNAASNHTINLQAGEFYTADFGVAPTVDVRGRAFDDLNANGIHEAAVSLTVPNSVQVDVPIPDAGMVSSTIYLESPETIVNDLDAYLDITHTFVGDLRAELISPSGTRVQLFNHLGGAGDNFSGTYFDDDAATSVTTATAPFQGVYRPQQSLTAFNGELVEGAWTLEVYDDAAADVGLLNFWGLVAEVPGPAEPALPGVTVYVDLDQNGVLNTTTVQGDSTGVVPIPDYPGSASSAVQISDVYAPVADVDVYLEISHTHVGQLNVDLVSPWGTRVRLMQMAGGSGDNFYGTILDDEAGRRIDEAVAGDAPFTGWWQPSSALADFDGERPDGTWTLQVTDLAGGHVGSIDFWSLRLTLGDIVTTTDAFGEYTFSNLPPGPLSIRQQLGHLRSPTLPRPAGEVVVERFDFHLNQYEQREPGYGSTLSPAAAFEGPQGLIPGRWLVGRAELEAPIIRKGDTLSAMLRFPEAARGSWTWVGFGAHDGGVMTVGVTPGIAGSAGSPATLAMWQLTGWDLSQPGVRPYQLTSAPMEGHLSDDVWYRLDVTWGLDSTIVARLYNAEDDPSTAHEAAAVAYWPVDEGTLAFRGKLDAGFPDFYVDRISIQRGAGQTVIAPNGVNYGVNFGSAADGIISGRTFQDSNGNGIDDDGRGLPGWHIYDDSNSNGLFDGPVITTHGDTRHWGIDDRSTTVASFNVAGLPGSVLDANAMVDIRHYSVGDLTAYLVSPQGTRVELFSNVGGSGDHFPFTWFDDSAATSIGSVSWPLPDEATYQPDGRLADFNSEDPNGVWRVVVADNSANGNEGTLRTALITLETGELETVTDVNGYYLGGELPARRYQLRQEQPDGWVRTAPQDTSWREIDLGSGQILLGQNFGNTRAGSIAGNVWHDHNANTIRDPGDEGVSGQGVFLDVDENGVRQAYFGQGFWQPEPRLIPDEWVVTSPLDVPELNGRILDVNVRLTIEHGYAADLDVYLHSPQGTRVTLFEDVGGSGDNFENTVLDDQAATSITAGAAPFSGSYRPEQPLSVLNGQWPTGRWFLEIVDDAGGDVGTLVDWELILATGDPLVTTDSSGAYQFNSVLPGSWSVRLEPRPNWVWIDPANGQQHASLYIEGEVTGVDFAVKMGTGGVDGDFNNDGLYNCTDINMLITDIASGNNSAGFDMTGDGLVNLTDRDAWLAEAGAINLGAGKSYLLGDANLDGNVDVSDFNLWNANKFSQPTPVMGWCQANFNGDNVTDVSDFNLWNANKFTAADAILGASNGIVTLRNGFDRAAVRLADPLRVDAALAEFKNPYDDVMEQPLRRPNLASIRIRQLERSSPVPNVRHGRPAQDELDAVDMWAAEWFRRPWEGYPGRRG